jgi:hypothetical protein
MVWDRPDQFYLVRDPGTSVGYLFAGIGVSSTPSPTY